MNYVVITESTCDLDINIINKLNIEIIPMDVTIDGNTFEHYPDFRNYNNKKFYDDLRSGSMATTSQINPEKYIQFFSPFLNEKKDILYLCFSSNLSSTYNSAMIAKMQLEEEFSNKVIVIDSLSASGGQGLLAMLAAENRDKGLSLKENAKWIEDNKLKLQHYFTVDDLMFLKRGGRISSTTAVIGSALKIKPVLHVNNEGKLINIAKTHGRRASLNLLFKYLEEKHVNLDNVIITHGDCIEDANYLKDKILAKYPDAGIQVNFSGPIIGAHTGYGLVALFFMGEKR